MKTLRLSVLAGLAAIVVSSLPAKATIINNLGPDPTSAAGHFSNDPNGPVGGVFFDQYLFQLLQSSYITVVTASNTFAVGGINGPNGIAGFTGAIYEIVGGVDTLPGVSNGGLDILRFGPQAATLCASGLCQQLDGNGILPGGNYYLAFAGNAGLTAGYGGDLSVSAVPIPAVGTGIPGIIGAVGGLIYWAKKRKAERLRRQQALLA